MGIGLIVACSVGDAERAIALAAAAGEPAPPRIGTIVAGDRTVTYTGQS
jgi:hypothetical protein